MTLPFLVVALMLAGASWSDLRTRRVLNQYWWPFVAIAAALWLSQPPEQALLAASSAAAMTGLAYLLWWVGTFGGADAKGIMVFAWIWPGVPDIFAARTLPVLDTLVNATLIAVALPLVFLAVNLLRGDFSFPAALLGTRIPLARAEARHVWPMQRLREDLAGRDTAIAPPATPAVPAGPPSAGFPSTPPPQGVEPHPPDGLALEPGVPPLRWRFWHRPGERLEQTYIGLRAAGVEYIWVTPKVPFMVPLALASAATWAWGNLVLRLLSPG